MGGTHSFDLLIVDDDDDFRDTCVRWMRKHGHHVDEAGDGQNALRLAEQKHFDVAIIDMNMPGLSGLELLQRLQISQVDTEVMILTGEATIETAVQAMKLGAYDYLTKPFPLVELERRAQMAFDRGQLSKENRHLRAIINRARPDFEIVGNSPPMKEVFRMVERSGPTDKAVLIQGESGTGKELVALALQKCSQRAERPFVTVNCAALPEMLVESELFGHEKGSFTGATASKPGLFEVANGGTLFIDEIGELPLALQPKLLRVLEDGSMRRVGSHKQRRVDVRIIAATNRDLSEEVAEHQFREDLYYRINVMSIKLPPLRERGADVGLLVDHFLGEEWSLEEDVRASLQAYPWPGNIRQLINAIDRAKVMADDCHITLDDLPEEVTDYDSSQSEHLPADTQKLDEIERAHVIDILKQHNGNKARAARALGIHRRKLYRLLDRYDIRLEN